MKAVEIKKTGGPEVIELKDITLDKPGPDQVTIEQKAIGLKLYRYLSQIRFVPINPANWLRFRGCRHYY